MPRVKLSLLLSSLLLLQIVTIEARKINLIKVNECLKTGLELSSSVAAKIVPEINSLINCVKFEVKINTERMTMMQMVLMVYQFIMYALKNQMDCMLHYYMTMAAITTPYKDKLGSLKCAYLFVEEPRC